MTPNQRMLLILVGTIGTLHLGFSVLKPLLVQENEAKSEKFNAFVKELEGK